MNLEKYKRRLASLGHRLSGSREDVSGTVIVREALATCGLPVGEESFRVPGHYGPALALNLLALLLACAAWPTLRGFALLLYGLVLVSLWGEMTFTFHILRRLIPPHASSNIEARIDTPAAQGTVVILAHHDSPRAGVLWHEKIAGRFAPRLARLPAPFNRFFLPPFAAAAVLGATLVLRSIGPAGFGVSAAAAAAAAVILFSFAVNVQWAVSPPSPGGNDNGSGLLVLMELAGRLREGDELPVNVRLVATGAEETGFFGIKRYLRNVRNWEKGTTLFINIESVGGGELHWTTGEAFLTRVRYPEAGLARLAAIEARGIVRALPRAVILAPTDALPIARAGFPVLTIIGLRQGAIPPHYHQMTDTFDRLDGANLAAAADIIEKIVRAYFSEPA